MKYTAIHCGILLLASLALAACGARREPAGSSAAEPAPAARPSDTARAAGGARSTTADSVSARFELNPVVPGKRIGKVTIGENIESVAKILGRSDSGDAAMGHAWQFWFSNGASARRTVLGVYSVLNNEATYPEVREIIITSNRFVTAGGIGVGSGLNAILNAFPGTILVSSNDSAYVGGMLKVYDHSKRGIAFALGGNDTSDSLRCVAIIVHRPGDHVESEYLPLGPNLWR